MFTVLTSFSAWSGETMRIAVMTDVTSVSVSADHLRWTAAQEGDDGWASLRAPNANITVKNGRLVMNGVVQSASGLRLTGDGAHRGLKVGNLRVRGEVAIYRDGDRLTVVNVLPLEDYLVGVLGGEMPRAFPLEALKAQAIAARTYALNKKIDQLDRPYYLGSNVISQVYKGLDVEDPKLALAVRSTRGLVLTWMLQPIEAYFHSSCGGKTETGLEALGRDLPYLTSVNCPCGSLSNTHWRLRLASTDLSAIGVPRFSRGERLDVDTRTSTGRVRRVKIGQQFIDAVTLRQRLGYMKLKSLNFDVHRSGSQWELEGSGFGHGSGLCQIGSRLYAERGWDFRAILQHYYPGAELQKLYD